MAAADLAIAVHRHLAGELQDEAFTAHGFAAADVERALRITTTPLAEQDAAEKRVGQVLIALRAPGVTIEHELREIVTDETQDERLQRLEDAGWFDAVVHRPGRELPRTVEAEAYQRGRFAFLAALQADRVSA